MVAVSARSREGMRDSADLLCMDWAQDLHIVTFTGGLFYCCVPPGTALPPRGEEDEAYCAVCGDGASVEPNQIVFCERCDVAVHQGCYGIGEIPHGGCPAEEGNQILPPSLPLGEGALRGH